MNLIATTSRGALALLLLTLTTHAQGEDDWPAFRGHRARGVAEGYALPTEWSAAEGENVAWKTPIPGLAHSSPIVLGERVYVTTAIRTGGEAELSSLYGSPGYGAGESVLDEGEHTFRLYALNAKTGEVEWQRDAYVGVPEVKRHPKSTHANSTPACDDERVLAFFGSEGLFCYDHAGELQWSRDFGVLDTGAPKLGGISETDDLQWGFASSPVLVGDRVLVQCDIQGQSFVTALDAATGEEVWRTNREENPTWSTPTVVEESVGGGPQVVLNGYLHIGGYDLATGKELWKLAGGGDVPVPTPVEAYGLIFITNAHGRFAPLMAIEAATATGTLSMNADECDPMIWSHPRRGIYMQTPLVYGEELYCCSDGGILAVFDVATGEQVYRERLGDGTSGFSGSAVAGDGKLYFTGEGGTIVVVAAGREFEVLARNEMGEVCMATPAIARGRLYVRTRSHLVAIEGEE